MTEETTQLVLEHLRHMRQRLHRVDEKVDTVILRLGIIEGHVANFHVSEAGQNLEIDRVKMRLDRIEKRLDLSDG
jgi:tetrahydromethanopterin S-methyltransferase subunit G